MNSLPTITLRSGETLECYPAQDKQISFTKEQTEELRQLLVKNAVLLYNHATTIMSDSRLFLAIADVDAKGCYATLGGLIELWIYGSRTFRHPTNDLFGSTDHTSLALAYDIAGNPMTGSCSITGAGPSGEPIRSRTGDYIHNYGIIYGARQRYNEAAKTFASYTLQEVIARITPMGPDMDEDTLLLTQVLHAEDKTDIASRISKYLAQAKQNK